MKSLTTTTATVAAAVAVNVTTTSAENAHLQNLFVVKHFCECFGRASNANFNA